mmetsp:Transcript_23766/g.76757  ORF Transcript_23766/g.76757 Transcript_23766/m.76757 type:complete len:248 (+) Transcript_23766:185-928(+)
MTDYVRTLFGGRHARRRRRTTGVQPSTGPRRTPSRLCGHQAWRLQLLDSTHHPWHPFTALIVILLRDALVLPIAARAGHRAHRVVEPGKEVGRLVRRVLDDGLAVLPLPVEPVCTQPDGWEKRGRARGSRGTRLASVRLISLRPTEQPARHSRLAQHANTAAGADSAAAWHLQVAVRVCLDALSVHLALLPIADVLGVGSPSVCPKAMDSAKVNLADVFVPDFPSVHAKPVHPAVLPLALVLIAACK